MDDENSEGQLRVLEEGASKLKKDGLRDLLVCVGICQAFDVCVIARSSPKAGPINDRSDFRAFVASSAKMRECMEVELAMKWSCRQGFFSAASVFRMMSTSAMQCAATLQGKRPLQKGTEANQEQENF